MRNPRERHKKDLLLLLICIIAGAVIGLFPLWNMIFLFVIVAGILSIISIIVLNIRYDYIVLLNIILLAIVMFDPSPGEIVFLLLLLFGLVNGELNFKKIEEQIFFCALFSGFLIINLIGLHNMIDPYWGIRYFIITLYLLALGLFFFTYSKREKFVFVLRAYVVSTIISAFLGFLGYIGYFSHILMYDEFRMQALFKDPNVFGPFLVPSVVILIDDLKSRKILGNHLTLYIFSIGLITLGAIFSFSRGAWINLAVCLIVYFFLNIKRYSIKKIIITILIVSLCIYFTWFFIFDDGLREFFYSRSSLQSYDLGRFTSQKIGLSLATERIFGYGPGQYELVALKKMGVEFSAHNLYIRLILENGIIGFILFMAAFIYIMLKLFQLHLKEGENMLIKSSLLFSILAGIMVNSLAIDTLHWRHLWFFLGVSLSIINDRNALREGGFHED